MHLYRYLIVALLLLSGIDTCLPATARAGKPYVEEERAPRRIRFLRPAKTTPGAQLAYAQSLKEADRLRKAARQYRALVSYWPSAPEAATAQFEYAQILEARGKWQQAFDQYQHLVETYAGQFDYTEVLKRQFQIAERMRTTRKGRFLFFPGFSAPERAIPLYQQIVDNGPRWPGADQAQFLIAQTYEETGQLNEAVFAFDRLISRYPQSPYVEAAQFRKSRVLVHLSEEMPNDLQAAETALIASAMFLQDYPQSVHAPEAREQIQIIQKRRAHIAYTKAHFYDRIAKEPVAAITAYTILLEQFPDSEWTEIARNRLAELRKKTGKTS